MATGITDLADRPAVLSWLMRTLLVILMCFAGLISCRSTEFIWRTESITAEVRRDDEFLKLGQYLHLEQKLRDNEQGWTMMKIDLPEHWTVEQITVSNGEVRVWTKGGTNFVLTKDNVTKMDFEIHDGGKKSDGLLETIWRKHALLPLPSYRP